MLCLVGENGMEWVKLLETSRDQRKVWRKIKWLQNYYDEIWEETGDMREWSIPSQIEGVISSTWCKEWNGGKNEIS